MSAYASRARAHLIRVVLPPTGRILDIGEQKRHHPRRSSRRSSGHPRRISQQTRSYLAHRLIRPGHPLDGFSDELRESQPDPHRLSHISGCQRVMVAFAIVDLRGKA